MVESFKADLHQREEEVTTIDPVTRIAKKTMHKPFNIAEVVITNLEMRAVSALFADPRKALVPLFQAQDQGETIQPSTYFATERCHPLLDKWVDFDDFVETDWIPTDPNPRLWMFKAAVCPSFTFFRSSRSPHGQRDEGADVESTKFGDEDTHLCLLEHGESECS